MNTKQTNINTKQNKSNQSTQINTVYAHMYFSHFHKIVSLGEEAQLNTCFKHFYYFINEFQLVEVKELEPLKELIVNLTKNDDHKK